MLQRLIAAIVIGSLISGSAQASLIVEIFDDGSDVVVIADGSLDISGLQLLGQISSPNPFVAPNTASLFTGAPGAVTVDRYALPNQGITEWGAGGSQSASTGAGDRFGIVGVGNTSSEIFLPTGYVSGALLSSSSTYFNTSVTSLGLLEGNYFYSWATATDEEFILITVTANESSAVPETTSMVAWLMFASIGSLVCYRVRSRNR